MAGGLRRRIKSLEAAHTGRACRERGWDGDWSNVELVVTWGEADPDPGPQWCGTCGHRLVYGVTWGDLPDARGIA